MKINTREELNAIRARYKASLGNQYKQILVCAGTGCVAGGSLDIYKRLQEIIEERGLKLTLVLQEEPHDEMIGFEEEWMSWFL